MTQNRSPISLNQVENFLSQQDIIRIFIDSVPYGYGNQAANKNLMSKIRQLGFSGKFEVIYFKDGKSVGNATVEKNKEKIARLFDLPPHFSDLFYDKDNNIEFIEATIFQTKKSAMDTVLISFSGSQLTFCLDALSNKRLNPDLLEMTNQGLKFKESSCHREADTLKSHLHVNIQPYYGETPLKTKPIVQFEKSKSEQAIPYVDGAKQFFITPVEDLNDSFNFINTSKYFPFYQFPSLKRFMLGLQAHEYHTIPIHGWPVQLLEKNPAKQRYREKFKDFFPGKILHYICAAAEALRQNPALQDKPLLLPVFYDYEQELEIIKNIIIHDEWGKYNDWKKRNPNIISYMNSLSLKDNFSVASLKNRSTITQINQLRPANIMLVSIGKLPQTLFHGLYIDAGGTVLTHVFEGENTRNALLSSAQKPFLRSLEWNLANFGLAPEKELQEKYVKYDTSKNFVFQSQWVASFIADAQKNNSAINTYFNYLYTQIKNLKNDRIICAIKKAINILLNDKLITENILNQPTIFDSQLYEYERFFNSLSHTFKMALIRTEANFLVNFNKYITSCPAYFNQDIDYWKNALNTNGASVCAIGYFAYQRYCITQPQINSDAIRGYLKF